MKKLLSILCVALAVLMLLPGHAYSRKVKESSGNNNNAQGSPSPSPTPAPAPVQGVISEVTPFAVSIKTSPEAVAQTYKVGSDTTISLNNMPVTVAALKPGMIATITPAADNIYATSVVASIPVAAPPPAPAATPGAAPVQPPPGATPPPFGRLSQ